MLASAKLSLPDYTSKHVGEQLKQVLDATLDLNTRVSLCVALRMIAMNTHRQIQQQRAALEANLQLAYQAKSKIFVEFDCVYDYANAMFQMGRLEQNKWYDIPVLKRYQNQLSENLATTLDRKSRTNIHACVGLVACLSTHLEDLYSQLDRLNNECENAVDKIAEFEDEYFSLSQKLKSRDNVNALRLLRMVSDKSFDVFTRNACLVLVGCYPQLFEQNFPVNFPEENTGMLGVRWRIPRNWGQIFFDGVDSAELTKFTDLFRDYLNHLPFPKMIESVITHLLIEYITESKTEYEKKPYANAKQICTADPAAFIKLIQIWLFYLNDPAIPAGTIGASFFQGVNVLSKPPVGFYKDINGVATTFSPPELESESETRTRVRSITANGSTKTSP